jgi:hypothetical protein
LPRGQGLIGFGGEGLQLLLDGCQFDLNRSLPFDRPRQVLFPIASRIGLSLEQLFARERQGLRQVLFWEMRLWPPLAGRRRRLADFPRPSLARGIWM